MPSIKNRESTFSEAADARTDRGWQRIGDIAAQVLTAIPAFPIRRDTAGLSEEGRRSRPSVTSNGEPDDNG